jgi:hypothetical protein
MYSSRVILSALAVACFASPLLAAAKNVTLGPWGDLALDVPEGWTSTMQGAGDPSGFAIKVDAPAEIPLILLVTPFPGPPAAETDQALRVIVESARSSASAKAVDPSLPVKPLEGSGCRGLYISVTDKTVTKPTREDFKYADQGVVSCGPILATFTLLTNLAQGRERGAALEMVRSARYVEPGPPWRRPGGTIALNPPDRPWRVALDVPGFRVQLPQARSEPPGLRMEGVNDQAGMMMTLFIEPSAPGRTAADHREDIWRHISADDRAQETDVRRSSRGDIALLEYRIREFAGRASNRKHLNAVLVKDGYWIDVHLSTLSDAEGEPAPFAAIVDSIRLEP